MTTTTTTTTTPVNIHNFMHYVWQTRMYGVTYVHAEIRRAVHSWEGALGTLDGRLVRATYGSWGRSLQAKGHKYKAWLRFEDTGKPVPTARLRDVQPV
jgi:hypothetical protein